MPRAVMARCFLHLVSPTAMCTGTKGNPGSRDGRPSLGKVSHIQTINVKPRAECFLRRCRRSRRPNCTCLALEGEGASGLTNRNLIRIIWFCWVFKIYISEDLDYSKYIDIPPASPKGAQTVSDRRAFCKCAETWILPCR